VALVEGGVRHQHILSKWFNMSFQSLSVDSGIMGFRFKDDCPSGASLDDSRRERNTRGKHQGSLPTKKTCDWKVLSTRYHILNITYVTTTTTTTMMMMVKRHCKTYHRTGTPSRNAARTNAKSCRTHKNAPGRSTEHVPTSGIWRISTDYNPPISANDCNISIGIDRWLLQYFLSLISQ